MTAPSDAPCRIAVTLGDPRGIGVEILRAALTEPLPPSYPADIVLVGPDDLIAGLPPSAAERIGIGAWQSGVGVGSPDHPTEHRRALKAGTLAGRAIERAAGLARSGAVDALVTAPIQKQATRLAGFPYPGHTEWLAALAEVPEIAMMLATPALRVVLITTHVALRDVPALLTTEKIVRVGSITTHALHAWWGIAAPRLAVAALNPHAGEGGLFGDEERRILEPAVRRLGATGPLPADTIFVRAMRGEFDAVLAPYHDVGMTAIKVAGFGHGVNVTLGLPYPRTSPDHGTAFDIAGQGKADPTSMRAALELAARLAHRNRERGAGQGECRSSRGA